MNAITSAFTPFLTVEEYANACNPQINKMPACYIRNDCAHVMNMWARFLKKVVRPRIKEFYLIAIGTLIITTDLKIARAIIKSILLICSCETIGNATITMNNAELLITQLATEETPNFIEIKNLIHNILVTTDIALDNDINDKEPSIDFYDETENDEEINENNELESSIGFSWRDWGLTIQNDVFSVLNSEEGNKDNPRVCPKIATQLLKKVETLPLWTNICRDSFGHGRVPASSAHIESEMNLVKTHILQKQIMRLDVIVEKLIEQDKGRLVILEMEETKKDDKNLKHSKGDQSDITINETVSETQILEDTYNSGKMDLIQNEDPFIVASMSEGENQITQSTLNEDEECEICKTICLPGSGYPCVLCSNVVHRKCSKAINEEGNYSQKRMCKNCSHDNHKGARLALKSCENWRGEGIEKVSKPGKYLGRNKSAVKDSLTFETFKKIPILKNGSSMGLEFTKIGNSKITVSNTCAFDSLFQILLAAAVDNAHIKDYIKDKRQDNLLFNVIDYTMGSLKITPKTYVMRAEAIMSTIPIIKKSNTMQYIDAATNIATLYENLFARQPTLIKQSECCGENVEKIVPFLTDELLLDSNFEDLALQRIIEVDPRICPACRNRKTEQWKLLHIDRVIAFEPAQISGPVQLDKIPKCLRAGEETFKLVGCVGFKGLNNTGSRCSTSLGHYIGIAFRRGKFIIYDDLNDREIATKSTHKILLSLLIYVII
ncbi:uncharacterized protein LOC118739408 isoform X1 [Rhagoletis pomonella]|uniref:uncharacterized protein LOC118739408 isoform X1 n=1 Tax=Rhagoletis pomonella TaxID=28610 RepID=UPI00177C3C25|nr:uncharacterized protein LOC118739408 isoform X1 [Rhagoletis pomonella]